MKDNDFIRGKNPMTKMEVRQTIISYLNLEDKHAFLDIGAGTGSVTIEVAKRYPHLEIVAIEKTESGCDTINLNQDKHQTDFKVIHDQAPSLKLPESMHFDAIYLGGTGKKLQDIMPWLESHHMSDQCQVVFSIITLETLNEVLSYFNNNPHYTDLEGSHLQVSRLETLGHYHYFKPLNGTYVIKASYQKEREVDE